MFWRHYVNEEQLKLKISKEKLKLKKKTILKSRLKEFEKYS